MYIGPHVTCLAFVYGCNKTEILWSDINKNFNTKFHENPSSWSRVFRADRLTDSFANSL